MTDEDSRDRPLPPRRLSVAVLPVAFNAVFWGSLFWVVDLPVEQFDYRLDFSNDTLGAIFLFLGVRAAAAVSGGREGASDLRTASAIALISIPVSLLSFRTEDALGGWVLVRDLGLVAFHIGTVLFLLGTARLLRSLGLREIVDAWASCYRSSLWVLLVPACWTVWKKHFGAPPGEPNVVLDIKADPGWVAFAFIVVVIQLCWFVRFLVVLHMSRKYASVWLESCEMNSTELESR